MSLSSVFRLRNDLAAEWTAYRTTPAPVIYKAKVGDGGAEFMAEGR